MANIKRDISLRILASRRDEQANFWALDNILCSFLLVVLYFVFDL